MRSEQSISNHSHAATVTTTVTTTITTIASALSYEPTIARFSHPSSVPNRLPGSSQADASAEAPAPLSLSGNGAHVDRLIDDLVQYFHAIEAERLARFLASARAARSEATHNGVQAAQAYAAHQ